MICLLQNITARRLRIWVIHWSIFKSISTFDALAAEVDRVAPRPGNTQGGRPAFPTETMVRILILKRLYNLSDEQMEYQ